MLEKKKASIKMCSVLSELWRQKAEVAKGILATKLLLRLPLKSIQRGA